MLKISIIESAAPPNIAAYVAAFFIGGTRDGVENSC
jgi:hypothetical protein